MSDNAGSFIWKVVINVRNNLDGDVRLSRAGWPDDHGQARLHAGANRLDLGRGEGHRVAFWLRVWVRA